MKYILLVDDDEDEYSIFSEALEILNLPLACIYVENADHAIQLLENVLPDYIFMDMNMPKINGIECIKKIKRLNKYDNIPIVLYSTNVNEDLKKKAFESGVAFCMQKSNSITTLAEALECFFKPSFGLYI